MPRQGYKSITVREKLYRQLEEVAKETTRTVPELIEHLLKHRGG